MFARIAVSCAKSPQLLRRHVHKPVTFYLFQHNWAQWENSTEFSSRINLHLRVKWLSVLSNWIVFIMGSGLSEQHGIQYIKDAIHE